MSSGTFELLGETEKKLVFTTGYVMNVSVTNRFAYDISIYYFN